jgi:hypothetical protein
MQLLFEDLKEKLKKKNINLSYQSIFRFYLANSSS